MKEPVTEIKCDACKGTGFPAVAQPIKPGKRVYPASCEKCGGKGCLPKAAN